MTSPRFAVRDVTHIKLSDGFTIVAITDVPCHLWFRWTVRKPWIHAIPALRRGLYLHADRYFCFVAYKDNEQEEAGDTLIHTFIKRDWPICQIRYYYFLGEADLKSSPSTTAIFKLHNPEWPEPPDFSLCLLDQYTIFPNPPTLDLCFKEEWW